MKHFIVEATYQAPFDKIAPVIPQHREFLQQGYDRNLFLCSGPKIPATGGFLLARAESREVLEEIFEEEPFFIRKLATFTFTEFDPVKRQAWANAWFSEETSTSVA